MNGITPKEAIANLNHIYGMVSPDIQRSLDVAIKALERPQGDCISRSELLKHSYGGDYDGCGGFSREYVYVKDINNAPTVSDRYDEGYAQGYVDGSTGADWKGGAE